MKTTNKAKVIAMMTVAGIVPVASPAQIRESGDVVVMRRNVAPPAADLQPHWRQLGDWTWVDANATCGTKRQRQTVRCESVGGAIDPGRCDASLKPDETRDMLRVEGCSYQYLYDAPGEWSSGCDAAATRKLAVTCRRSDGAPLKEGECVPFIGAADETKRMQSGSALYACGYEWQPGAYVWSSTCSATATHTRTISCSRTKAAANDPTRRYPAGTGAEETYCGSYATTQRPPENDGMTGNYEGCTGTWTSTMKDDTGCNDGYKLQSQVITCSSGDRCDPRTRPAAIPQQKVTCTVAKQTCTMVKGQRVSLENVRANNGAVRTSYQDALDYCQNTFDGMNACQIEQSGANFFVNAYAAGYVAFASPYANFSAGRCVKN